MSFDLTSYKFYQQLIALPFVKAVWLFGSRARGDNMERADIDLAISCPNATAANWHELLAVVENADTLLKIDVLFFERLKDGSALKQSILREGIKVYEK